MDTEYNRRGFLKMVGAAGLGYVFASAKTMAEPNEPNAPKPNSLRAPKFVPGREVRIDVNDKDVGGDYFVVYVPSDYTDEHDWPAIFFFNGAGGGPSTQLFKSITEGKGFIFPPQYYGCNP